MKNLAGNRDATEEFRTELARCGIEVVPSAEQDGETRAEVDGVADLGGGFSLRIVRRWVYASARITPPLPIDAAHEVNETPHVEDGTRYSTHCGKLGGLARADGFAGGLFGDDLRRLAGRSVGIWHVDAIGALGALVAALRKTIATRGLSAEDVRRGYVAAETDEWLRECAPKLSDRGAISQIMRRDLHGNPNLDASDPRITALRASFPEVPRG